MGKCCNAKQKKVKALRTFDHNQAKLKSKRFNARQCGPVVRTLALRSGVPGLKTRSDHSLNLFPEVPRSTARAHL